MTGEYELVVVWANGDRDVYGRYDSADAAEQSGANMRMALGNQIAWCGVREKALRTQTAFMPVCVGSVGGRKLYAITFEDGTEADYFIDFKTKEIERY